MESNDARQPDNVEIGGASRPVLDFVTSQVTAVEPTMSLRDTAAVLRREQVSFAAVGEGAAIEGVVSERDLVGAIASGLDLDSTSIAAIESDGLKWAQATSTVAEVAAEMLDTAVRHVLVCHADGSLAGVVSMRDLLEAYVR
ncbi:MAG: CBS domain-containing protein [Ilumatobacter sp.]